jgi:PhoPQ-activated pathogenicity-related protein
MTSNLSQATEPLFDYVDKPDAAFAWKAGSSKDLSKDVTLTEISLTSQTWHGITWKHHLSVLKPKEMKEKPTALLFITGNYHADETALYASLVEKTHQPLFVLWDIPNQPLFDDLSEDALISYTFQKYLETDDPTWALLLPMTKGARRAMDAAEAFAKQEWKTDLAGFVVTGASKRGWTTWLTGATDKRVRGIAPMVFDNLNFGPQMKHQIDSWGKFSEQIADYTEKGLVGELETPKGKPLTELVDPYTYRKRLTMPKLIINGTNDRYWTLDSAHFYYDDLSGPKNLLYDPNSGHGLNDIERVVNTLTAFWDAVSSRKKLPIFSSLSQRLTKMNNENGTLSFTVEMSAPAKAVRGWTVSSDSRDFRDSKWTSTPFKSDGSKFSGTLSLPAKGFSAAFVEAEFEGPTGTYTISSPVSIFNDKGEDITAGRKAP